MRLFSEQELLMIGITSLPELLDHLLSRLPEAFGLDTLSLLLIDKDYELSRLLMQEGQHLLQLPELLIDADDARVRDLYQAESLPQLSPYRAEQHQTLFHGAIAPHSVALLPLSRGGRLIGSL